MENNLNYKDLIIEIQKIWSENKKSKELIKYFEILLKEKQDIDVELYLIYLNTLVNLGEYNKALLEVECNENIVNVKEIITFKIKLLFFLKRYKECENYIKSVTLDEDNKVLAQKILNQIKPKNSKKEVDENISKITVTKKLTEIKEEKSIIESENNSSVKQEVDINKELKSEVIKEAYTNNDEIEEIKPINKENRKKKSKIKIIIPVISLIIVLLGVGVYFWQKSTTNDIAIETYINLNNNEDLSEYKSSKYNVDYELPIDIEFEFVSSTKSSNENKQIYVTYKVSDESIATITEDGFFKGKKVGVVDIQTLNKNKVVDTITIEIINKENIQNEKTDEVLNDTSHEGNIQEFLQSYERDYIKAVNEGNYDIIKKYLVEDGPLDKEHSKNIKDFYDNGIRERLDSLQFLSINKISDIEYLANVKETIAIIKNGEEKLKEFDSFYSVMLQDNGKYLISEMQIRSTNEISSNTEEKLTVDEAIDLCTERLKEINWYDDYYGEADYYGESEKDNTKGFYYIIYDGGESFYVDPYNKHVYYILPAGDGLNGPL